MRLPFLVNPQAICVLVVQVMLLISLASCGSRSTNTVHSRDFAFCTHANGVLICTLLCENGNCSNQILIADNSKTTITCESGGCNGTTINCTTAQQCDIQCKSYGCGNTNIICSNTSVCNVDCDEDGCNGIKITQPNTVHCQGARGCEAAVISSDDAITEIICSSDDSCKNSSITAPKVTLSCSADRACIYSTINATQTDFTCTGYDSCYQLNSNSESLNMNCTGNGTCKFATVATQNMNLTCEGVEACHTLNVYSANSLFGLCDGWQACQSSILFSKLMEMTCNSNTSCASGKMSYNDLTLKCNQPGSCQSLGVFCLQGKTTLCPYICISPDTCPVPIITPIYSNSTSISVSRTHSRSAFASASSTPSTSGSVSITRSRSASASATRTPSRTSSPTSSRTKTRSATPDISFTPSSSNSGTPSRTTTRSASIEPSKSPAPSPGILVINENLDITSNTLIVNQTVVIEGSLSGDSSKIIFPVESGNVVKVEGNITITGVIILQLGTNGLLNPKDVTVFEFANDSFANMDLVFQIVHSDGSPLGECEDVDVVQKQTSTSLAVTLMPKEQNQDCGDEASEDDTGKIIGIVVGTVVGVFVLVVVVIVLVIVVIMIVKYKLSNKL